jgi:hypothetical protein
MRCCTAGPTFAGGGGTDTIDVDGRSPNTGGNPLRSRKSRIEAYRFRKLLGTALLTARTIRE